MKRWELIAAGVFFLFCWFACWAASVIPGSDAGYGQWIMGNGLAFLAGAACTAAAMKPTTRTKVRTDRR